MNTITVTSGRILYDGSGIQAVAVAGYDRDRKQWIAYLEQDGETTIRKTPTREDAQQACATFIGRAKTRMSAAEPSDEEK